MLGWKQQEIVDSLKELGIAEITRERVTQIVNNVTEVTKVAKSDFSRGKKVGEIAEYRVFKKPKSW